MINRKQKKKIMKENSIKVSHVHSQRFICCFIFFDFKFYSFIFQKHKFENIKKNQHNLHQQLTTKNNKKKKDVKHKPVKESFMHK